jgi:hypothetical protein
MGLRPLRLVRWSRFCINTPRRRRIAGPLSRRPAYSWRWRSARPYWSSVCNVRCLPLRSEPIPSGRGPTAIVEPVTPVDVGDGVTVYHHHERPAASNQVSLPPYQPRLPTSIPRTRSRSPASKPARSRPFASRSANSCCDMHARQQTTTRAGTLFVAACGSAERWTRPRRSCTLTTSDQRQD